MLTVNGEEFKVEMEREPEPEKKKPVVRPAAVEPAAAPAVAGGATVNSPLPGVVLEIKVKDGDKVTKGQVIMVLEAMKMENAIEAPCDGTVTIKAQKGDSVLEGATLAVIA